MLIICAQQRFMEPALQAPTQGSSLENIGRLTVEIYLCLNIFVLFFFGICLVLFCFCWYQMQSNAELQKIYKLAIH